MCIAIYKPEGFILTPDTIKESWASNRDGAGFMYHENEQLFVVKGLMTLAEFEEAYEPHKTKDCVLHFRIKTHGATDQTNTHPFNIDENLGVVHNGIISAVDTSTDTTKSDTWHFAQNHLYEFRMDNKKFFLNPVYKAMIENYIGYSKLIFMDNMGNVEIMNENKGVWDSGCWFSNTSYRPYVPKQVHPPQNWRDKRKASNTPWYEKDVPKLPLKPKYTPMVAGDTVRVVRDITSDEGTIIPVGSYVKVKCFTQYNSVCIEEVLTELTATTPVFSLAQLGEYFNDPNLISL